MTMEPTHSSRQPQQLPLVDQEEEDTPARMMSAPSLYDSSDEHDGESPVMESLYKPASAPAGHWNLGDERKTPFSRMATNWAIHEITTLCDDQLFPSGSLRDRNELDVIYASEVTVQGTVGQGGFSSVLKVSHNNRTMALKRLRPNHHRIRCENDLVKSATDLTQEISILSKLDHPHIIKLLGVRSGTVSESYRKGAPGFFFCMPLLEETLDQRLERWRNAEKEHSGRRRFLLFGSRKQRRPSVAAPPTPAAAPSSSPRQRERRSAQRSSQESVASISSTASTPIRRASLSSLTGLIRRRPSGSESLDTRSCHTPSRNASAPAQSNATFGTVPTAQLTPPPPSLICRLKQVALPIARGMRYLHDQKVLWRDLKPANIGFDEAGELKMFDFGLSRHAEDQSLRGHGCDVAGTFAYMAPESVMGIKTTYESDVYSFGVLLWELVTLKKPFPKSMRTSKAKFKDKVVVGGWRPPLQGIESRALRRLIDVCWDMSPRNRPSFHRIWFLLIRIIAELEQKAEGPSCDLKTQSCHNSSTSNNKDNSSKSSLSSKFSSLSSSGFLKAMRKSPPPRPASKYPPRQLSDCTAETDQDASLPFTVSSGAS